MGLVGLRKFARRLLDTSAGICLGIGRRLYESPMERRVRPWFQNDGDNTLRVAYDLGPDSIVFDVGGYRGQWASDLFSKYLCQIVVFEPVPEYAATILERFSRNPKISVHAVGLSAETTQAEISIAADRSSLFGVRATEPISIQLQSAASFIEARGYKQIDLMKINIEGAEYDLLDHLLDHGLVSSIVDLQIQFHDFVPDAAQRMANIQARLSRTHRLTYQYEFVWENWHRESTVAPAPAT